MQIRTLLFTATLALAFAITAPVVRAEPQPGSPCPAADQYVQVGGPENPGAGLLMVCDGTTWNRVFEYDNAANLGVKQLAPKAPLHVGGEVIIGTTTGLACDANREGALRYNNTDKIIEICDGTSWAKLVASTCDSAPAFPSFTPQTNLAVSTLVMSNIEQITGMDAGCSVTVSVSGTGGPQYRICTAADCSTEQQTWTNLNLPFGDLQGKWVQLRATSSASAGTEVLTTINIGPVPSIWSITTLPADCSLTAIGTVCADGTVHAGNSPAAGGHPMFVTRCDAGLTWDGSACTGSRSAIKWNNGAFSWATDTSLNNCSSAAACDKDGESNTSILIIEDSDSNAAGVQPHAAAQYCADLNLSGKTDWFLPSAPELDVMHTNKVAIANFETTVTYYWSSSEFDFKNGWRQNFANSSQVATAKNTNNAIRCARRDVDVTPAAFDLTNLIGQAANSVIVSNIVQITGISIATGVNIGGEGSPEFRICSAADCSTVIQGWTTLGTTISNNDYLQLRLTTDVSPSITRTATVTVGTVNDTYAVTTNNAPCTDASPSIGVICADGTVYAGLSPADSTKMFTTRCDAGMTWDGSTCTGARSSIAWNNGNTTSYTDTSLVNCGSVPACDPDGETETSILITEDSDSGVIGVQPHAAAQYCTDLNLNGQTDWYLPSAPELNVMYTNNVAVANFDISGNWYTTSSESSSTNVWLQKFNDGAQLAASKSGRLVRCARRDVDITPATFNFTDLTGQTGNSTVVSNVVQITGIDAATGVRVSGAGIPEFRICSDVTCSTVIQGWTTIGTTISNNNYLQLRLTSHASLTRTATVFAGTVSDTWSVTPVAAACTDASPPIGLVCADGSVYAGLSPADSTKMFTTRCDAGMTWDGSTCTGTNTVASWNDGNTNWVDTSLVNCSSVPGCTKDGRTNTNTLIIEDSNSVTGGVQQHVAAQYCADLNLHGQTDWYLPSAGELDLMRTNQVAIENFDTLGVIHYWSSSEKSLNVGWYQKFTDGNWLGGSRTKEWNNYIRCVRR